MLNSGKQIRGERIFFTQIISTLNLNIKLPQYYNLVNLSNTWQVAIMLRIGFFQYGLDGLISWIFGNRNCGRTSWKFKIWWRRARILGSLTSWRNGIFDFRKRFLKSWKSASKIPSDACLNSPPAYKNFFNDYL